MDADTKVELMLMEQCRLRLQDAGQTVRKAISYLRRTEMDVTALEVVARHLSNYQEMIKDKRLSLVDDKLV